VVLGLGDTRAATQTELGEVVAQLGERLLLQEAGEVPGAVAHHLGLADADEQRVELVGHRLLRHRLRGGSQGDLHLVHLPAGLAVAHAVRATGQLAEVDFAEPNWIYTHQATTNDTYFTNGTLWGMYGATGSPANQFGSGASLVSSNDCSNVWVGIIDEGYMYAHTDLAANAGKNPGEVAGDGIDNDGNGLVDDVWGWDFDGGNSSLFDGAGDDHGTHVAGTVGANTWGIAKAVALVPVRVLDCNGSGSLSGVIAGLDWVAKNGNKPAVVNMSLGGGASSSLDSAVANTVAAGYTVVVAAGNSNANACNYSPAREPSAITVGATTSTDFRASYSNYGSCLDLFAPGSSITSTWYSSTSATATLNGTSMASPHVAGLAALLLQGTPTASASTITSSILNNSTSNKVQDAGSGSPNRLIYTLGGSDTPPPPEPDTTVVGVAQLTGSATSLRNGWRASFTILVKDESDAAVGGAYVTGSFSFSNGSSSSVACTTGSNGSCSVSTGTLSKKINSTTYTVQNITGTSLSFDGIKASLKIDKPQ